MARRRVLVRRLPALETLSAVSVVCTDKTGTLTENRMTVRATWTPWSEAPLLGPSAPDAVRRLFAAAALCTDAVLLARRQALATGLPPPRPGAGGDMHGRIPRHVWWAAGVDLEGLRAAAPALLHHAADPTTTAIQARATTAALAAIVACQMANLFACRSERLSA